MLDIFYFPVKKAKKQGSVMTALFAIISLVRLLVACDSVEEGKDGRMR